MSHSPRRRAALAATAAAGLAVASLASANTALAAGGSQRQVVSQAPAWTAHAGGSKALASSTAIHAKVWLAPRNQAALQQLAAAVSDPASSSYGHYLTADQYRAQYAPTSAQVADLEQWLKGAGLTVQGVGPDNNFLAVAGSPAEIDAAFGTTERGFTVNGSAVMAPTSAVTVPSSAAGQVLAVTGLDTLAHHASPDSTSGDAAHPDGAGQGVTLGPPPGFVNAGPCSASYGAHVDTTDPAFNGSKLPYAVCGYVPSQFRDAYGVSQSGLTGRGVTVAITDAFASQTIESDANTYAARHGDAAFTKGQFEQHNATGYDPQRVSDCGGNGWYGEETLDVEAVHGIAPDANVLYYGAASCYDDDLMAAMAQAVSDDQASMVTNSWGEPTYVVVDGVTYPTIDSSLVAAYDSIFTQATAKGIGFYYSSGDNGDDAATWGVKGTDFPASDPNVTAVGGTALAIGRDGTRQFETGWGTERYTLTSGSWTGETWLYGAGGGCSAYFTTQPRYQKGAASGCKGRAVPDISMDADPTTGMLVGETQNFGGAQTVWGSGTAYGEYRIGGTSLASPLMAGLAAVAQSGAGHRLGFANPLIYSLAAQKHGSPYYDVTHEGDAGNIRVDYVNGLNGDNGTRTTVRTFDQDASLTTGNGWDDVSGVGSPTAAFISDVSGR